jgi:hypothetical protein
LRSIPLNLRLRISTADREIEGSHADADAALEARTIGLAPV